MPATMMAMREGRPGEAPIAGLVFDLDGTLLDSERVALEAWRVAQRRCGLTLSDALYQSLIGANGSRANALIAAEITDEAACRTFHEVFHRAYEEALAVGGVPVKPGAREILAWARSRALRVGLATSTRREVADRKLATTGLGPFFDFTVCGDEVAASKPAPEIFAAACRGLGLEAGQVVALEDSPNGVRSASGAGLRVILVPDLARLGDDIRALAWSEEPDLAAAQAKLAQSLGADGGDAPPPVASRQT